VAVHQLVFDDSYVDSYDTNYKVNPPLREKKDIEALKAGLKNGVIDLLVSGHMPQDEESKNLEFDLADFGIIGLQTFLPLLNSLKEDLSIEEVIENFTTRPRKILGLKIPEIKEGEDANLTLFDPNKEWTYTLENNLSISKNSPLLGQKLKGGVLGTFNNGKSYLTEDFS
jgi:dihydroorotase